MQNTTTNSLFIGKTVLELLEKSTSLTDLVGVNIHPVIVQKDTVFPYVVYRRSGLETSYTKDNYATDDTVTIDVIAVSQSYSESLNVAQAVRMALENKKGDFKDLRINSIELVDAQEGGEDVFVQSLTFKINCK